MSSRLDRNLITVVTGQAVDAFDRLFRTLYVTSSSVDLRKVATEPEPEREPLPQLVSVPLPSAAVARKLYNPKYALALGNPSTSPSPTPSPGHNSPRETQSPENSRSPEVPDTKKRRRRRASKEAAQEAPPIHPGLTNLEKACLITYLPTWPEPDPPSDVIGFINIRDTSKPTQVHLQRSEMFETSQAIRFSSPFSMPAETLPEVAKPRQLTAKHEETDKLHPLEDKTKAKESEEDTQLNAQPAEGEAEAPEQNSPASGPKCETHQDTAKTLNAEEKLYSSSPTDQDADHNTTPHLNAHSPPRSISKASTPHTGRASHTTQAVITGSPKPSDTEEEAETGFNRKSVVVYRTHNSHMSPSSPSAMCLQSVTSTFLSENSHVSICLPLTSSSTNLNPSLPSSSSLTSTPPIPKPRTIQLIIKDSVTGDDEKLPELSVVKRPETGTGPLVVHSEPAVVQTPAEKEPETVPELQSHSGSETGAQKDADNRGNIGEAPQQKQSGTSQESENEEAFRLHDDRAGTQLLAATNLETQSHVLISGAPKADSVQEIIPKDVDLKTLTSTDCKLSPRMDCAATVQPPERALTGCEFAEDSKNVTQFKAYRASALEPQRISYNALTPQDVGVLDTADSLNAPPYTPVFARYNPHMSIDSADDRTHTSAADTHDQPGSPRFTPAHCADSVPNADKHNTRSTSLPSDVHVPDLRSPTPERQPRPVIALVRTTSPDGFPPRTPTPDSQTHTPDPRSYTPDFRTPTPDVSEECVSPRPDSALSTTSDEYFECSDSPLHEPVLDRAAYRNHGMTEDRGNFSHSNTPNATAVATSPACINYKPHAATLGTTDRSTSSSSLSGPASISSSSSLLEKNLKMGEEEETANEENEREVDEKGSVAQRRREVDSQRTQRRDIEETKRTADYIKQGHGLTETAEKNKEAQVQAPKRKRVLNQSTAGRLFSRGVSPTNEGAEPKRLSTGDLKPKKVSSEGERPDKEKAADGAALGPSISERRARPRSAGETEGQKVGTVRQLPPSHRDNF